MNRSISFISNLLKNINFFIFFYVVNSNIFPPMKLIPYNNIIIIIAILFWYISAFLINGSYFKKMKIHSFFILVFILYTSVVPYIFENSVIGNRYINFFQIFFFYIGYNYYKKNDKEKIKKIIQISSAFLILVSIRTFVALLKNPYISRSIKSKGEYSEELWRQCIGGYELIYMLAFVAIILFTIGFIEQKKFENNNKAKLGFILSVILIVVSNYFTALIIVLSGVVGIVLLKLINKNKIYSIPLLSIVLVVLLGFGRNIYIFILTFLIINIPEGRTKERFIQLKDEVLKGTKSQLLDDRISVNKISVNSFKENKILGIITKKIKTEEGYLVGFGQHSQLLDTFALFGLGIGVLQIYLLVYPFLKIIKKSSNKESAIIICLEMLLLFYNNIATASVGFVLFFIFPAICDRIDNK